MKYIVLVFRSECSTVLLGCVGLLQVRTAKPVSGHESMQACVRAYLPAYPPTCLPTYLNFVM